VTAFHLGELSKQPRQLQHLFNKLEYLYIPSRGTIFLFSSPQLIWCNKPTVHDFLFRCLLNKLIWQVALDEVHLFVKFGDTSPAEFQELGIFFSKIDFATVPFLLMTATCCSLSIVQRLETIIGQPIKNHHWPDATGMQHRQQTILILKEVAYLCLRLAFGGSPNLACLCAFSETLTDLSKDLS
jgi:hypothetical protein